ncbi:unnamed protein product [Linum trigynum]|uniref:DUF3615 domain-containing protein n=1 Tax=Linum trigynum TaxID=586398 RepID=A0AAV2EJC8_9ROSI
MEGPHHHQIQEGAGETAPPLSSLNPAPPVVSAEENVEAPQDVQEAAGDDQPVAQAPKCIDDGDDEYDRGEHEAMLSDTAKIATEALEFYNNKEGTNFVLRKPLLSWCNLFPGTLAIHANFKAKNVVDPAVPENNPPSQLFFSETLKVYRQPTRILNCLIMDKRSSTQVYAQVVHIVRPTYAAQLSTILLWGIRSMARMRRRIMQGLITMNRPAHQTMKSSY